MARLNPITIRRIIPQLILPRRIRSRMGGLGEESLDSGWSILPLELRRIILGYVQVGVGTYFSLLSEHIDKSTGSFYNTGCIRVRLTEGFCSIIKECLPQVGGQVGGYRRGVRPGIRIYTNETDLRQYRLWLSYGRSMSGNSRGPVATGLDSARWEPASPWDQSCRLHEDRIKKAAEDRARDQIVSTITESHCETHSFYIGLITQKIFPEIPELYDGEKFSKWREDISEDEIGYTTGSRVRSFDEHTYRLEQLEKSREERQESESLSEYEEDSEYDTEYDPRTGEEIESISLAKYDEHDRLYFERRPHTSATDRISSCLTRVSAFFRNRVKPFSGYVHRIANAHLKSIDGSTILEPISWRMSINPKWRCTSNSRYNPLDPEEEIVVIGNRYHILFDVEPDISGMYENQWTTWGDKTRLTHSADINLFQYYHVGIVDAYFPQPGFVDLIKEHKYSVLIPLLDAHDFYFTPPRLMMSHYSLHKGLNRKATLITGIDLEHTVIADPDGLYV